MCSAFLDLAILAELGGAGEIHREDDLHTLLADRVRITLRGFAVTVSELSDLFRGLDGLNVETC